jgi:predicted Fe-Mo cluster-binding NifX family protein
MKVALTVWDGRISPVFDVCRELLLITVEGETATSRVNESVGGVHGLLKIERLMELGVETLICGAISEDLRWDLTSRGVDVVGFVAGETEQVLQAFLTGKLPASLAMPGCRSRQKALVAELLRRRGRGKGRKRGPARGKRLGTGRRQGQRQTQSRRRASELGQGRRRGGSS